MIQVHFYCLAWTFLVYKINYKIFFPQTQVTFFGDVGIGSHLLYFSPFDVVRNLLVL